MNAPPSMSPAPISGAWNSASVRTRIQRIREDIVAAESKIERIRLRIERDRQALLLWQARLTGNSDEQQSKR